MSGLVSIVMPVYNRESLIGAAIGSIARQSYANIEVIIVDDGSSDNTPEVAKHLLRSLSLNGRVVTINNGGPDKARDIGIEYTSGEYVAFIDSDDLWENNYLETMVSALDCHETAMFAFSDFWISDELGNSLYTKNSTLTVFHRDLAKCYNDVNYIDRDFFQYLLVEQPIFPSALVFRKAAYIALGPTTRFIEERIGSLEWEFFLRMAQVYALLYVRMPLVRIRKHEGNFSANFNVQTQGEIKVLSVVWQNYVLSELEKQIVRKQLALRSFTVGYNYLALDNMPLARQFFIFSLSWTADVKTFIYLCLSFLPYKSLVKIKEFLRG